MIRGGTGVAWGRRKNVPIVYSTKCATQYNQTRAQILVYYLLRTYLVLKVKIHHPYLVRRLVDGKYRHSDDVLSRGVLVDTVDVSVSVLATIGWE